MPKQDYQRNLQFVLLFINALVAVNECHTPAVFNSKLWDCTISNGSDQINTSL